ncbi:hypothetical protein BGZ51_000135 [Haplosporangium sp. Z 767]|nr:hypothetical protein BGZ50_009160 [Haplosporangium sp. Z 11]KAF9194383.1 hypothetical protein BGZ51_000135 [Haplosporangium sp. Z 767]
MESGARTRFTFTSQHLALLEKEYASSVYPSKVTKAVLSRSIGCTETQVQNWFSRHRTRDAVESKGEKEKITMLEKLQKQEIRNASDPLDINTARIIASSSPQAKSGSPDASSGTRAATPPRDKERTSTSSERPNALSNAVSSKPSRDRESENGKSGSMNVSLISGPLKTEREKGRAVDRFGPYDEPAMKLPKFKKGKPTPPMDIVKERQMGFFKELTTSPTTATTTSAPSSTPPTQAASPTELITLEQTSATQVQEGNLLEKTPSSLSALLAEPTLPSPTEEQTTTSQQSTQPTSGEINENSTMTDLDIAASMTQTVTTTFPTDAQESEVLLKPSSKPKKTVRFNDNELVSIRYIEPRPLPGEEEVLSDDEEFDSSMDQSGVDNHHNYQSAFEKAPPAFYMPKVIMDALVRGDLWRVPPLLKLDPTNNPERGSKSVEKDIQEQRELETLSENYLHDSFIPPSPAEPDPEPLTENSATPVPPKMIALFEPTRDPSAVLLNSLTLLQQIANNNNKAINTAPAPQPQPQPTAQSSLLAQVSGYIQQHQQQQQQTQYQVQAASAATPLSAMYNLAALVQQTQYQQPYQQPYQQTYQQPYQQSSYQQQYQQQYLQQDQTQQQQSIYTAYQQAYQTQQQNQQQSHQQPNVSSSSYGYYYQGNMPGPT